MKPCPICTLPIGPEDTWIIRGQGDWLAVERWHGSCHNMDRAKEAVLGSWGHSLCIPTYAAGKRAVTVDDYDQEDE